MAGVAGVVRGVVKVGVLSRRLSHPIGVALGFISLGGITGVTSGVVGVDVVIAIVDREEDV